jgi:phosphatidate cytidylyltransferase
MASRILVAVVGIPVLLALLLFCPTIAIAVVAGLLCAIAAYELLGKTGYLRYRVMLIATMVIAFGVPFWVYFDCNVVAAVGGVLVFSIAQFGAAFASHEDVTIGELGACYLGGIMIPCMFSSLVLLADMDSHRYLVLLPFFAAFGSDSMALFVGMNLGKHKLAPVLSPHKTVEGAFGGLAGGVLFCAVYALALRTLTGSAPSLPVFMAYGLLGSGVSQFGDLAFSYMKRQFKIKDYGHLFLAHGGVLDRFDSVIFCAPLTVVMVSLFPFFIQ